MAVENTSNILIIGAGTWGCSIALELARRGHTGIKVLDGSPFPSAISAGNDLNKITEEANEPSENDSDETYFWNRITQIAMQAWTHDPLFAPFYHETGFIMAAPADLVPLNSKEDFHKTMPEGVLQGNFPGWHGFWKQRGAGWVYASGAMKALYGEARRLGVQFVTGELEGKVEELILTSGHDAVLGARTSDSVIHTACKTILAAGANSINLLDFKKQLRPTAWTLAHVPLSAEEAQLYRNLPVLYGVDRGFFIEPDIERHEMKICDEHPGYINLVIDSNGDTHSVPFARRQIPKEAETRMRRLLSETTPQFSGRKFSFARICWDADTVDRMFLIDKHPVLENLVVAVGGSGNGFMACPAIGILVVDNLEEAGQIEERVRKMMRWRPETSVHRDWWDAQGRCGADGKVIDFRDVEEWTSI
ncbi:FAD dependent oxidoreductase [Cucurbitaria berberidis CBS 394.84]|uniref:FAD dependent oxidoreductase n=1 Tax=Cucurbitaria berberidis CBS 394.84 TaxID=1168544 RepID=A0A9P4GEK0_9PLEO|nr:FAD dependent oxidoreductase [Cucurbitaria berberidis CBS 394.84]KAF1844004.1 FAD dependent oxidoreductase [Cucurbitaria berberidis CBS 394.84]